MAKAFRRQRAEIEALCLFSGIASFSGKGYTMPKHAVWDLFCTSNAISHLLCITPNWCQYVTTAHSGISFSKPQHSRTKLILKVLCSPSHWLVPSPISNAAQISTTSSNEQLYSKKGEEQSSCCNLGKKLARSIQYPLLSKAVASDKAISLTHSLRTQYLLKLIY